MMKTMPGSLFCNGWGNCYAGTQREPGPSCGLRRRVASDAALWAFVWPA